MAKKILLLTGSVDGIGLEVACKALLKVKIPGDTQIALYFQNARSAEKYIKKISAKKQILLIPRADDPVDWLIEATQLCLKNKNFAMVNGPLNKTDFKKKNLAFVGHTDYFSQLLNIPLRMAFLGTKFQVVLHSDHLPMNQVAENFTQQKIQETLQLAHLAKRHLPAKLKKLPLAWLGLNPHAGEQTMIGNEEAAVSDAILAWAKKKKVNLQGPLVPDAAFLPKNWNKFSFFVCAYHDQGLIPFKALHGQKEGAHWTLGLPFVRTSVDHGTAADLFGKNKADCGSMKSALMWCFQLMR